MSARKKSDSMIGYHHFLDDQDSEYGSFEVIWLDKKFQETPQDECDGTFARSGWYWVAGFPGYLWDGDPVGPFDTSAEAYHNAQGY